MPFASIIKSCFFFDKRAWLKQNSGMQLNWIGNQKLIFCRYDILFAYFVVEAKSKMYKTRIIFVQIYVHEEL